MVEKKNNKNQPTGLTLDEINVQYGKLPPQAIEVEEAVLGALMLERDAFQIISGIIDGPVFYKESNQKIFQAIRSMATKEMPIDLLTVTMELKNTGTLEDIGGPSYLTGLTRKVASAAHIEFHAKILAQKFLQRELIRISAETQNRAYDDSADIDDLIAQAREVLNDLENFAVSANTFKTTDAVAYETVIEIEKDVVRNREGETPGIPTGLKDLDRSTGGWRNTNLITLAARPGVGKTSFALFLAVSAARKGFWVNFYGLEMKSHDLFRILLSGEAGIPRTALRDGKVEESDWERINIAVSELEKLPILWYDNPDININQIAANTRRNKKQGRCGFVIIDYLQLVTPTDKKAIREQQIAEITRKLKLAALREDIPIMQLSQLNREIDKRTDKQPNLSDLRESGAIEQNSDVVVFLYEDEDGTKLKIAKNRRGKTGHPDFWCNKEKTKFYDHDHGDYGFHPDERIDPAAGMTSSVDF